MYFDKLKVAEQFNMFFTTVASSNGLMYEFQSGFRQSFSTNTCLIHLTDYIKFQSDKGNCDDVDNGLDNTCEVIRQETVLFSTPETDYIIYD